MPKCSLLIASCFLFGSPLIAGPIPTLEITSFTASERSFGPTVFSGSGPSVTIDGSEQPTPLEPVPVPTVGVPFFFSYPVNGDITEGVATITGYTPTFLLFLYGGFGVSGIPTVSGFPAVATGHFTALDCGFNLSSFPNCPQIANIDINLSGFITGAATFTSISTPEPSSMLLLLLGAMAIRIGSIGRQKNSAVRQIMFGR
jgi:hypothetical protein